LHGKYEDLYNHVAGLIDDIAERLLIIGGKPVASLAGALKLATIQELEDKEIKADDTVKIVLQDIQLLAKQAKQVIEQAESEHDHATEDMIVGHLAEYQKWTWMLQSNLAI
jgi:starvation-inducible DNA-binding protein